jgi:protein O-mannosyl-transferase
VVLIVVAAIAVYANSLPNEFVYDDDLIVVGDPRTRDPALWREIFTRGYWYRVSTDPIYRPVPLLTYLLNHSITGLSPAGYRVVNLALHAGVSLLVYAIALELSRKRLAALLAGLLFAVHPIHAEAVVIIVGRADLLSAFLYLLGVWLILREPMTFPSRNVRRLIATLIAAGLAMLSKENAVTFVAAAVLADCWRRWRASPLHKGGLEGGSAAGQAHGAWTAGRGAVDGRAVGDTGDATPSSARPPLIKGRRVDAGPVSWRAFVIDRFVRRYLPIVAVTGLVLLARYQVFGHLTRPPGNFGGGIENVLDSATGAARVLTPLVLLGKYLTLLVVPHPLCYDYSYNAIPVATSLVDRRVLVALGWVALMVVAAILSWHRGRRLLWCVAFFLISYSVVSNSVVLIGTLFAERAIYLPSAAWCWAVALGVVAAYDACGRWIAGGRVAGAVVIVVAVAALGACAMKTAVRNRVFRNDEALYADGVRVNPGSSPCWSFAARGYMAKNDHKTAIRYLGKALAIDDTVWYDHLLIGQEYALDGQVDRGLEHLHRAYTMASGKYRFEPAFLLGQIYVRIGRYAEAADWLKKALAITPDHALCQANLKLALERLATPPR